MPAARSRYITLRSKLATGLHVKRAPCCITTCLEVPCMHLCCLSKVVMTHQHALHATMLAEQAHAMHLC
jgi:hypothetical protein